MRVLVVEDEVKLASALKMALENQNYAVDTAHDGEAGLELIGSESYDILILDSMMPKLSGVELCKEVRRQKISVPIIMLTAKGEVTDKVIALDSGADDYMTKPFAFDELFSRVRALVRRSYAQTKNVLECEDLVLDTSAMKAFRSKKEITLSAKEFALLEYLLRNKGRVLSKDQIIQHVWNYDANVLPNTVEAHIKHLRQKIDVGYTQKLLKTVRGFGYVLGEK